MDVGIQFYPTPKNVIEVMAKGHNLLKAKILDPSAGKADLLIGLKEIAENQMREKFREMKISSYHLETGVSLHAIEIDPILRGYLSTLGDVEVIDSDFLQYNGIKKFDFIFMNPPFADGDKHLLHAWEIARGATIVCLLNAETINNPYSQRRKELIQIINKYGEVKMLGDVFKDAEAPTGVNIAMVTLVSPDKSFDFKYTPETESTSPNFNGDLPINEVAPYDMLQSMEQQYNAGIAAIQEAMSAMGKVDYYIGQITGKSAIDLFAKMNTIRSLTDNYDKLVGDVNEAAWHKVFTRTKLSSLVTSSVRDGLSSMEAETGKMAFTARNMHDLFETLYLSRDKIATQSILDAFDIMTKYYDKNRESVPGWKTNASYFVGKKVILPYSADSFFWGLSYKRKETIRDIEKALCIMVGEPFESIESASENHGQKSAPGKWYSSRFFDSKLYLKGTLHLRWRHEEERKQFNMIVAENRWGGIPENIKTGAYK